MVKHACGLSNTEAGITALRESLRFLRGTIYGWQSEGTSRRPDSFRNGHVSFWPGLFFHAWFFMIELCGWGGGERQAWDGVNTDVALMFSEMVRLTLWHRCCWFGPGSPASCQSGGGRSRRSYPGLRTGPDGRLMNSHNLGLSVE